MAGLGRNPAIQTSSPEGLSLAEASEGRVGIRCSSRLLGGESLMSPEITASENNANEAEHDIEPHRLARKRARLSGRGSAD